MSDSTVKPPPLTQNEVQQAEKLVRFSAMSPRPPLSSDPDLLECLYYPLRTTNLPSFQYEMLVWDADKLNVFSDGLEGKITSPRGNPFTNPQTKYKRVDDFTVLAVVIDGDAAAIFTNEISRTSWELIGVLGSPNFSNQIGKHSLVDYPNIESSYKYQQETKKSEADNSSDEYWDQYDKVADEAEEKKTEEMDEETYYNKHCEQSPELDAQKVRSSAVQALVDLGNLYKDCGVELSVAIQDIQNIALQSVPMPSNAPYIAHRHALRTIAWVKQSSMAFKDEICAAIDVLTRQNI